jgi:hypothetical protein
MAGVEAHKTIARIPSDHMAEGFNHGEPFGDFRKFTTSSVDGFVSFT